MIRPHPRSTLFPNPPLSRSGSVPPVTNPKYLGPALATVAGEPSSDRKSTRLNSSHSQISYAVFCLKKKKTERLTLALRIDITDISLLQSLHQHLSATHVHLG